MSWYLADHSEILGQFASVCGLIPLRTARDGYPALKAFFAQGATKNTSACISGLDSTAKGHADADVKSTAAGLAKLMQGQKAVFITDGSTADEEETVKESLK